MAKNVALVRIINCSPQMISIQVKPPQGDFYREEQQVRIMPHKDVILPKDHLIESQITNLAGRRMIKIVDVS